MGGAHAGSTPGYANADSKVALHWTIGEQKVYFYFFQRPECYNQEVSHSVICLPLPYMEGIVLICNIDLYCVIAIFSGTGDMFKR